MRIAYHVMSSPVGLLFLALSERGLRHLEFMDRKSIKRMIASHTEAGSTDVWEASLLSLKPVVDQLEAYFCGALTEYEIPLDLIGTDFQKAVWKQLTRIPFGETRTYGDIAKAVHQPKAARAVGLANNQNPVAIVVPCHRVIGANGSLTGYGGGMQRKRWLLQHEARFAQAEAGTNVAATGAAMRSAPRRAFR